MRVLLMLVAALILTACGGPGQYKATTPQGQVVLDQDVAKCRYEAEAGSYSAAAGASGAIEVEYRKIQAQKSLFRLCMKSKGWDVPIGST